MHYFHDALAFADRQGGEKTGDYSNRLYRSKLSIGCGFEVKDKMGRSVEGFDQFEGGVKTSNLHVIINRIKYRIYCFCTIYHSEIILIFHYIK